MFTFIKTIRELKKTVENLVHNERVARESISTHEYRLAGHLSAITSIRASMPVYREMHCPECKGKISAVLPPFPKDSYPVQTVNVSCPYCNSLVHVVATMTHTTAQVDPPHPESPTDEKNELLDLLEEVQKQLSPAWNYDNIRARIDKAISKHRQ